MGLVLMVGVTISKSLIQISVDGWSCVPSLLFTFVQAMVEVMKIIATSFNMSHAWAAIVSVPSLLSIPLLTHSFTGDYWTLMDKYRSISCGVTAPFSWVLVYTRFCLCPGRVCFPVLCKFWGSMVGLMVTSSKRVYAIPRSSPPRGCAPDMYLHRRYSNTVLSQSLWGLWVLVQQRFV